MEAVQMKLTTVVAVVVVVAMVTNANVVSHKDALQNDPQWLVDGTRIDGMEVTVPIQYNDGQHTFSLHSNASFHPVITLGSVTLDLEQVAGNTTLTLMISCFPDANCTAQIGNITRTVSLSERPPSFTLTAEERGNGRYLIVYHRPTKERHVDEAAERGLNKGQIVALVILGVMMAGIVVVVGVSSWRHGTPGPVRRPGVVFSLPHQEVPLLSPAADTLSDVIEEEGSSTLWEAVVAGDVVAVKALLAEGLDPRDIEPKRTTCPLLDAHLLGRGQVLEVLNNYLGPAAEEDSEGMIERVLQEWDKMTRQIFVAAECGMYEHEGGVGARLNAFFLPGTLRDDQGRSLIHYMASPTAMDGRPPWEAKDIVKFLTTHEHLINSVDFSGRTALHHLSAHPYHDHDRIIWGGGEWVAEEAWVSVAQLLMQYGCDPRLKDLGGHLAHELASQAGNGELAEFLGERCEELGPSGEGFSAATLSRLARAAGSGNTILLKQLLESSPRLGPTQPTTALALAAALQEAVVGSQREAVLMLLCAGASPMCAAGQSRLTPLYAASHASGLPAVLPALLRQACYHQLLLEAQSPRAAGALQQGLQVLAHHVLEEGARAKWVFNNKGNEAEMQEARSLLRTAAVAGLPLACRALSQQGHCLHALLPGHTPVSSAHPNVVAILLHELDMTPVAGGDLDGVATRCPTGEARRQRECALLEDVVEREGDPSRRAAARRMIAVLLGEGERCREPEPEVVVTAAAMAARLGLAVALVDMAACWPSLDLAVPVEPVWGGTVLYVGVLWGHVGVVEAVACLEVGHGQQALGSMNACHIAAVTGHVALLEYLQQQWQHQNLPTEEACVAGFTPRQLLAGVRAWAALRGTLTRSQALGVLLLPRGALRTMEVVRLRAMNLGVTNLEDLLQLSEAWMQPVAVMPHLEAEARRLCGAVAEAGLPGTVISVSHVLGDGSHAVMLYVLQDDALKTEAPRTLRKVFMDALGSTLGTHKSADSRLCPAPPFLTYTTEGVTLGYLSSEESEVQLLRLTLVPVLPADPGPTLAHALVSEGVVGTVVHVAPMCEGWVCLPSVTLNMTMARLQGDWRQAWAVCRFLNKLLEPRWWSPAHVTHHVGTAPIPDHALASVFLHQRAEEKGPRDEEGDISTARLTAAVLDRAAHGDFGPVWATMDDFLPALCTEIRPAASAEVAEGILAYLNDLLRTAQQQLEAPRVTFKDI